MSCHPKALGIRRDRAEGPECGVAGRLEDVVNILSPFTREFWIDDSDVRRAVKRVPEAGVKAMQQARLSAIALETDREQLRADLMQRLRENKDERARLDAALDELDALRTLETAT